MAFMKMKMLFPFLASVFMVTVLVFAQTDDQEGFLSIDCGASTNYTDEVSGLKYQVDTTFTESGVKGSISSTMQTATLVKQFVTLRSFPNGTRNCYTLRPSTAVSSRFLIRARFLYGNYDELSSFPTFDLYLGPNLWSTIQVYDSGTSSSKEIIVNITSEYTSVCLVNTALGTPFISALELRPVKGPIYAPEYGALNLYRRFDFGSNTDNVIRYKEDVFDRLWVPFSWPAMNYINTFLAAEANTSLVFDADISNDFRLPSIVMGTAITPKNVNESIFISWDPEDLSKVSTEYYVYMHFAEIQKLQLNQTREFDVTLNGELWYSGVQPTYLYTNTLYSSSPKSNPSFAFQLTKTANSTLPPLINAVEIYEVNKLLQSPTSKHEVNAMKNIKSLYGVNKNWQGDPCAPQKYTWIGLNCSFNGFDPPKITYLNLSSSGLIGKMPSYVGDLTYLQILDLSNNNLNGLVPGFLTQLSSLTVLNLSKNNLTGPLPEELLEKHRKGLLSVSMDGFSNHCSSVSCKTENNKKVTAVVVALVAALIIFLIALATLWSYKRISRKGQAVKQDEMKLKLKGRLMDAENRHFTYLEILSITKNLETVIGKGGFGPVYHGYLEGTEVAVKMLSSSSIQGYKEFRAEIEFLTRVHHVNLTTLVGYCDEGDNIGLIYEYMANGNLKDHLSDRHPNVLSWAKRLRAAVDAATRLEYLHHACKPPIIHRDVKSANILLDQKFQAKLADFGLSKDFPDDCTHLSTAVAGTPGYLDPEYHISYQLTEKSDVFSFGVVLLEIISSRPVLTRDQKNAHIIQWVSFVLRNDIDARNIIDPRLGREFEVNSLEKAIDIAMACASPTSALRPSMNRVVTELNQCLAMEMTRIGDNLVTQRVNSSLEVSVTFDSEISLVGR